MLNTPFGEINFYIDDILTSDVKLTKLMSDKSCFSELDGRYSAVINFIPDGKSHRITCKIEDYTSSENDGIESGEKLVSVGFHKNSGKLSIGIEYDCDICKDGKFYSPYDYKCAYSKEGFVEFITDESTKTSEYVFGIAWIEKNITGDGLTQTWLGADPTFYFY